MPQRVAVSTVPHVGLRQLGGQLSWLRRACGSGRALVQRSKWGGEILKIPSPPVVFPVGACCPRRAWPPDCSGGVRLQDQGGGGSTVLPLL
ncbi:UNVERIFIED_CONTAM: hypothetical protein FKN15_041860 [Acipenser sinensis]